MMGRMTNKTVKDRIYFNSPTGARIGTMRYYEEAMNARFYGVDDEGRAFASGAKA